MRLLLLSLLLVSVVSLVASCGNPAVYVNGYWNLTAPSYSIPIDTSAACAASANSTYISTNGAYYNQPGTIVGTNSTGSPACCPALAPGGSTGPCCYSPVPVPPSACQNYVCAGNGSSSGVGCPAVVAECLVLAQYKWVYYQSSSTGMNGSSTDRMSGAAAGGAGLSIGAAIGSVIGWLLLSILA